MSMQVLKEVGARWIVTMAEYLSKNPQFIVNGFVKSGMSAAMDGVIEELAVEEINDSEPESDADYKTDSDPEQ